MSYTPTITPNSTPNVTPTTTPFSGLVVVEAASVLAGPLVGQFFAELGARVIKLENATTDGDGTRGWRSSGESAQSDISAYFASANFGKESVSVNMHSEADLQLCHRILRHADVFIHNWKPGDEQRFGLDYQSCARANPRLVYASVNGYGNTNTRVGYDAVVQAECGLMSINGNSNGPATKLPVALIDVLAAHQLKQAILVALFRREHTNTGTRVDVSLMDTALSSLVNQATNYLHTGAVPQRAGSEHPNIVPYGTVFTTADNVQILLAVGTDAQYRDLCAVLNIPLRLEYSRNHDRVLHREQVNRELREAILSMQADELLEAFDTKKIPAGRIQTIDRALQSQNAPNVLLSSDDVYGLRSAVFQSPDISLLQTLRRPPHLDEHGDALRQEFAAIDPAR
jgi:crotonobetainyl-CoA:carnitine CoA-transferase CaiB-like acyl-CoA transferase